MTAERAGLPPLAGIGVAVTRAEEPGGPLSRRLTRLGARVLGWQTIEVVPPEDPGPLMRSLASLGAYDWIVFASARAVAAVAAVTAVGAHLGPASPARPRVATVGPATAAAAEAAGFHVERVPERFGAAGLLADLAGRGEMAGARVLLPASSIELPELAAGLETLGAAVDRVTAYRVRPAALDAERCRGELAAGEVDAITFTSQSAVASLAEALGPEELSRWVGRPFVVSIGPTTTRALLDRGVEPNAEARTSTLDGVVAALAAGFVREDPRSGPPSPQKHSSRGSR